MTTGLLGTLASLPASIFLGSLPSITNSGPAVSPTNPTVSQGATQQFTATGFAGTVTFSITGNALGCTIGSSSGSFVAGTTVGSVVVTATDGTTTITENVTIPTVAVSISPTNPSMGTSATQQFSAIVTGAANNTVTWTETGGVSIPSGLFTSLATPGSATATATSVADPTKSATANITISSVYTYTTGIAPVPSGVTPTLAIFNVADGSAASVVGGVPFQRGSSQSWLANFTANPGTYECEWTVSGTLAGTEFAKQTTIDNSVLNGVASLGTSVASVSTAVTTVNTSVASVNAKLGTPASGSVSSDIASVASGAGLFVPGTISTVSSASMFTVAFTGSAPNILNLPGLFCSNTSAANQPAKQEITSATLLDSTHLVLTFATPFGVMPGVGNSVLVG